ncbi:MAG: SDR family NAD(P)-dependent oxidoreductase [Alphaproteobacteria bacterium]|nr:MAG: SDR family NAD(P)-dependent oxidoreductase [Alphaproteobacteria bacterium]
MQNPKSILITGASSGIGRALALHYARAGVTLALNGRNRERLELVARECRARGAKVIADVVDVTDEPALTAWIHAVDDKAPLDLVIANAGVSLGYRSGTPLGDHTGDTFAVNVWGVLHTIHAAIERMRARHRGRVAIMSSLAGFLGFPSAPAYSASKASVKAYGEALRGMLAPEGIAVNVICPGFVESPMTDRNSFPMPFLMPAHRAARIIARGLERNKGRIAFPWPLVAVLRLVGLLPASWLEWLLARLPAKV